MRLLHAHRRAERAVLTPEVLAPAGDAAAGAVRDLAVLDADIDATTEALVATAVDSPDLAGLGERLGVLLAQHAALVDDLTRQLESVVARKQVRLLGGEYAGARDAALQDDGAGRVPRRLDLSRAELYELARKAGIEGRSAMSRGELIARLQQLQQHERA